MLLVFEHIYRLPLDMVFAFHTNPASLSVLLQYRPSFRLLHHDGHVRVGAGTWFQETFCGCIPVVMGFRHTTLEAPHGFGEEMIHGPFRRFTHVHEFEAVAHGTLVRDTLDFELPNIYGGKLATRVVVAPILQKVFAHRHNIMTHLAAQGLLRDNSGPPFSRAT